MINFSLKTEKQLLSLCKKGSREAFDELLSREGNYIKMWIFKYCKGNQALGEEIYSQTIIKCWQKIKTFKGDIVLKKIGEDVTFILDKNLLQVISQNPDNQQLIQNFKHFCGNCFSWIN